MEDGQAHASCGFSGEVGDGGLHAIELAQDAAGAFDDDEPGAGELHAPSNALQECGAGFFFEGCNLLRDCGGGEAERLCRGDDGAPLLDFEEHLHASDVVDGHGVLLLSPVGAPVEVFVSAGERRARVNFLAAGRL